MGQMIELAAQDGHGFTAYQVDPPGKPRGGVVVIQEIFGVNNHIKAVADGYAGDGYLVIAPAMFDRARPNYDSGYSQAEIQAGVAVMQSLNWDQTMQDVVAAVGHAKSGGKVGIVGYCWAERWPGCLRRAFPRSPARRPITGAACRTSSAKSRAVR